MYGLYLGNTSLLDHYFLASGVFLILMTVITFIGASIEELDYIPSYIDSLEK